MTLFENPSVFAFFLFCISVCAGVMGAVLGLGGGILIVPVLTLFLGVNIRYAVGASIVAVIATSSGAAAAYVKDRITNVRLAVLLEVATTLGALTGAAFSGRFTSGMLSVCFSLLLVYSAAMMLRRRNSELLPVKKSHEWARRLKLHSSYPDAQLKREVTYGIARVPQGFALMYGAGVLSALLGIGSGILKVPAMDTAMRVPIKVSSATSNFMIGVTAAASAGAYFMRGDILPILAGPIALGVLVGAKLGARWMVRMQSVWIRRVFIGILILIASQMILKAVRHGF